MLRDTKARHRKRVPIWGIEGSLLIPMVAFCFSAVLCAAVVVQKGFDVMNIIIAWSPFIAVYGYMFIFITGRRPHFARDLLMSLGPHTRSVTKAAPFLQPKHPTLKRR